MKEDRFYSTIPTELRESLQRYEDQHIAPCSFLQAVLSNDLVDAVSRAGPAHRDVLSVLTVYIYNEMPRDCWGSREKVDAWVAAGSPRYPNEREGGEP